MRISDWSSDVCSSDLSPIPNPQSRPSDARTDPPAPRPSRAARDRAVGPRPAAVGRRQRRGRGRRPLVAGAAPGARPGPVLAVAAHARDARSGARAGRLRRPAPGGRHLRGLARRAGHAGGPAPGGRAAAGRRPQSRARTPGRADAQRPVRRLPWHAAGVDRGAGAAVRRRHRTGRRDPVRVLVAVTPRDTFAAIAACLVVALLLVPVVRAAEIDPAASHVGFTLKTRDRKSTRRTPVTNAHLVCRLLLEKKNNTE